LVLATFRIALLPLRQESPAHLTDWWQPVDLVGRQPVRVRRRKEISHWVQPFTKEITGSVPSAGRLSPDGAMCRLRRLTAGSQLHWIGRPVGRTII